MNVVLMMADQMRADCAGCYGNSLIRTPHLDRLAAEGTRFDAAFAQHPQCVPSRAAILTGRYVHENGALSNHVAMDECEVTLGEIYRAAGYRSIGVGKLHVFDQKERAGFTDTMLCGGQNSDATSADVLREDYKRWAKENGYWDTLQRAYAAHAEPAYRESFQAVVSPLPAEAYIDSWVGDRAVDFIRAQDPDEPFFMFVGFPNPHNPFEPPEPYASMYDPADMPIPATFQCDLSAKPPHQLAYKREGRKNIGVNYEGLGVEHLRKVIAYYYASITLVDDQVGKIMAALEARGMLDNTVVAFVSDHGEFLGDYGLLLKPTDRYPMLYDISLRVPLICRMPGGSRGRVISEPVELIDLPPTLLEASGLQMPPEVQGQSLLAALTGGQVIKREFIFAEIGAVKMLRGERYKLVYYPGRPYGELYDLASDPRELHNLHGDPAYAGVRTALTQALLDRMILMEGPRHGESRRGPAYWRTLYNLPQA